MINSTKMQIMLEIMLLQCWSKFFTQNFFRPIRRKKHIQLGAYFQGGSIAPRCGPCPHSHHSSMLHICWTFLLPEEELEPEASTISRGGSSSEDELEEEDTETMATRCQNDDTVLKRYRFPRHWFIEVIFLGFFQNSTPMACSQWKTFRTIYVPT